MNRHAISREIQCELAKLNDMIDRKIIRGQSFVCEARRHKELLVTLRRIRGEYPPAVRSTWRTFRRVTSPARRSVAGGAVARLLGFGVV